MRYLLLGGVSVLSMILTACVSPQVSIFGAQMDMLLAVLLGMVAWEQTMTPVFYVTLAAVWMDAFFAKALGFYALQYLLVGMGLCLFLKDRRLDIVGVMLTAAGAWVLREVLGVVLCFLMDAPVGLWNRLWHSTLPGMLPQALLSLGAYAFLGRLYRLRMLWPTGKYLDRG